MKNFSLLEKKLDIEFKKRDLLIQAFCHRSFINEHPDFRMGNNERLEFLGDAVLELIVTEDIFKDYPKEPEGRLTSWRSSLVNAKALSETSRSLGFNDFLLLSKGESKESGKARQYILADTFEAFIGAFYIDQGYGACRDFIKRHLMVKLPEIIKKGLFRDAKSLFQEKAQEKEETTPSYKVLKEWGPDHARTFAVGVFLGKDLVAKGSGFSKQEAEEDAAKNGLETKGW